MKTLVCALLFCSSLVLAAAPEGWPVLWVGRTEYRDVKVVSADATTLRISHATGVASLPLKDLSKEIQEAFHYRAAKEVPPSVANTPTGPTKIKNNQYMQRLYGQGKDDFGERVVSGGTKTVPWKSITFRVGRVNPTCIEAASVIIHEPKGDHTDIAPVSLILCDPKGMKAGEVYNVSAVLVGHGVAGDEKMPKWGVKEAPVKEHGDALKP